MNTALFYDTETTGLPNWSAPSGDPSQPHLVQLAALLVDMDSRETISTIDLIIKPDNWEISKEVSEIHGITQEMALDVGISEDTATLILWQMGGEILRIGHNESFDARIMRIALKRYFDDEIADAWKAGSSACTAGLSKKIVNCPPTEKMKAANRFHAKTPTMQEAYKHFFGKEFDGAHSALADAKACRDVYFAVKDAENHA